MKKKILQAISFWKYICSEMPEYSDRFTYALIKDIRRIVRAK